MKIKACSEHQYLDGLEATRTEQDRIKFFSCDLMEPYKELECYLLGYSCHNCTWED